jgi:large subunit ribosomal protein L30
MTYLKVTLLRSSIGTTANQRETLMGLGLRKIGKSRRLQNTPSVRGMVKNVIHLVQVEEVSDGG